MKRGRFAPSPTGPLHFGSLLAALASFCDARSQGGEWLLRIEDVDRPRARRDAAAHILSTLSRYGFRWDGPVVKQSQRTARYESALDALVMRGRVFGCACSRQDLAPAAIGATGERVYPGTCRDGLPAARAARAQRVRVDAERIEFVDRLQGRCTQDLAREAGDFVLRRADGVHAYHLAVVVDDAEQAITDVVRGADLLPSTPRQIFLQRALGYPTPAYLHIPVAVDQRGRKLSKQTGAAALPEAPLEPLLKAWAFLGQSPPVRAPAALDEFWSFAFRAWNPAQIPVATALPAA